jgi:polar amino acid transport system ATP-binding protein
MSETQIRVQGLIKDFGSLRVLRGVDTEIAKGEVISIIGPSGCGKSTFLRCLNRLEEPTGGSIVVNGQDILAPGTDVAQMRQRMNMVFQSFNLFAHLTALENLTLAPMHLRGMTRAEAEDKAMALLRLVGLAERAHYFPSELSGGQKQRVAIARCLAMDPEVILLDEPTSALDPTMVAEVLAVVRNLARQGLTLLIVTHEMDFARDVSSRVFFMHEGRIHEEGPPAQIFESPRRPETRAFIHRVRARHYTLASPDVDIFALHGDIETFCEKHLLPRQTAHDLQLLAEELVLCFMDDLRQGHAFELAVEYLEARRTVGAALTLPAGVTSPFRQNAGQDAEQDSDPDPEHSLSLQLIRNLAPVIEHEAADDASAGLAAGERIVFTLRSP